MFQTTKFNRYSHTFLSWKYTQVHWYRHKFTCHVSWSNKDISWKHNGKTNFLCRGGTTHFTL